MAIRIDRLSVGFTKTEKSDVQRAAQILGMSTAAFVLEAARAQARNVMSQAGYDVGLVVSSSESRRLLDAIDEACSPKNSPPDWTGE